MFSWRARRLSIGPLPTPLVPRLGRLVGLASEPAASGLARDIPVLRDAAGYALDLGPQLDLMRCGPDEESLLLYLGGRLHELLFSGRGWHVVHGAGLVLGGEAWIFLGPSHVGKSTLAVEAWLQDIEVLGDDKLLLHAAEGNVEVVPLPVKVRLDEPAVPARLASRAATGACALGVFYDELVLMLGRACPGMVPVSRPYPLGGVCVLTRDHGRRGWRRAKADRLGLVRAVLEQTFVGPERGLAVLEPFRELLRRGRAWTLAIGDGATAAAVAAWRENPLQDGGQPI